MEELFAENAENSRKIEAYLNTMAIRIATVFASLRVRSLIFFHTTNIKIQCDIEVLELFYLLFGGFSTTALVSSVVVLGRKSDDKINTIYSMVYFRLDLSY